MTDKISEKSHKNSYPKTQRAVAANKAVEASKKKNIADKTMLFYSEDF